ncbi:hypothetical protein A2Y85_04170 [candidate division WOR-3 bacterium RBG_13_43_14]|uniref:Uncharacterized protein n=1 Tax=candidate division WOR-3 bacterium RBG_13_43_14 TaxID=1802590 RepID=A0A1F4UFC2_UNCW3|nr:MAG: hypothetical protein A2Y85_04170 [candidate division WOR-3 bacterium RBG_13_43_14]
MKKSLPLFLFGIILINVIALYPCLNNGFVNWDDNEYVVYNTDIRELNRDTIKRIFSSHYQGAFVPLTILTFALEYKIAGINPQIYHATNLILHILNSLMVFWLVMLLFENPLIALITAVFFSIHPLQVEPVAWVTGRKDLLYSIFYLGACITYIYYFLNKRIMLYIISALIFTFSMLSKPFAITLPLLLFTFDYQLKRRFDLSSFLEKLPFLVLAVLLFFITIKTQQVAGAVPGSFINPNNLVLAFNNITFYLWKTLMPINLSPIYPYYNTWWYIIVIILLVAAIIYSRSRAIIFGALFFIITLLPAMQLVRIGQPIADRYVYIPLIGLFIIIAWVANKYISRSNLLKIVIISIIIACASICTYMSHQRCKVWKNSITLWQDAIKKWPQLSLGHNTLGIAYAQKNRLNDAITEFTRAIELKPDYAEAYNNRGNALGQLGDMQAALNDFNNAINLNPGLADAYYNRAIIHIIQKNYDIALLDLYAVKRLGGYVPDDMIRELETRIYALDK